MRAQAATLPLDQAELVPTSAMSEFELEAGYSGLGVNPVARPCACGEDRAYAVPPFSGTAGRGAQVALLFPAGNGGQDVAESATVRVARKMTSFETQMSE